MGICGDPEEETKTTKVGQNKGKVEPGKSGSKSPGVKGKPGLGGLSI